MFAFNRTFGLYGIKSLRGLRSKTTHLTAAALMRGVIANSFARVASSNLEYKELTKVLRHYLCCVIQSMYELGVDPTFGSVAA